MDRDKALRALERMERIAKAISEMPPKARRADPNILYHKGDVTITESDVDDAIEDARQLVGDEFASLLVAPLYKAK